MRRMIPSLQSLICFEAAAKHLSYTFAAQELHLTQSAISRQVQQLEDFLGLNLFNRTRHGVELTQAGEHYYKNFKTHLLGIEQSTLDLMSHKGLGGTLNWGLYRHLQHAGSYPDCINSMKYTLKLPFI